MRKKIIKKCVICGKNFIVFDGIGRIPRKIKKYPIRNFRTKTCSKECSSIYNKECNRLELIKWRKNKKNDKS